MGNGGGGAYEYRRNEEEGGKEEVRKVAATGGGCRRIGVALCTRHAAEHHILPVFTSGHSEGLKSSTNCPSTLYILT